MLTITNNNWNDSNLELVKPVEDFKINDKTVMFFDNDGFELSVLEQEYYLENDIFLNPILNHSCDQREWVRCNDKNFKIDHSILLQRWKFAKEAKKQLKNKINAFPQLNKYLKLQNKWGLDFALEYYDQENSLEVLHIETDYKNYEEALQGKEIFEKKLLATDWHDFVKSLIKNKHKWESLQGMDQNDWKAVHWGLKKAEITHKVFI